MATFIGLIEEPKAKAKPKEEATEEAAEIKEEPKAKAKKK